jgi:hypothetical protein
MNVNAGPIKLAASLYGRICDPRENSAFERGVRWSERACPVFGITTPRRILVRVGGGRPKTGGDRQAHVSGTCAGSEQSALSEPGASTRPVPDLLTLRPVPVKLRRTRHCRVRLSGLFQAFWYREEPLATIRNLTAVPEMPATQAGDQLARQAASGTDTRQAVEWDWFAAERLAISVAGSSDDALDDVHTILIHLRDKVPGSSVHRSALARGVSNENLWHDPGFISGVRAIAANKLTDIRRAATRRRQPRFRRPNGPIVGPEVWRRYPPFFLIVSADTVAEREPLVSTGPEIPDTDQASPSDTVEQAESEQHARQIVGATLRGLRHSDIETLDFALLQYTPLVHGNRVDEALAAHLSQKGPRAITRDAARRRLTDARIRLEDAIVGQHREVLLGTLQHIPTHELGHQLRSALLAYLTMVGTRPREVVMDTALQTLRATVDPNGLTCPDRPTLASAVAAGLRQLYARHQALWGEPFFAHSEEPHPSRGVRK